jgi:DNA-binding helix-hairpin-helix protein with protein kinase domain
LAELLRLIRADVTVDVFAMRIQRQKTGEIVLLTDDCQLGVGGEARIYVLPEDPSKVVKVWHQPTIDRARKVQAMLANPPVDPMAKQGHVAIAWPEELVTEIPPNPAVVGFIMPRVVEMHPIIDFFNPRTRLQRCPLFNYFYLVRTARNLATALRALHERGYVVGDFNECNILASETALVTMVDTDSFQVWDAAQGKLFRCPVGRPEFTPPELQGKSFAKVNREPAHDLFGLGIVVFQLLMEGTHPFAGVYQGRGDAPTIAERIGAGHFPYAKDPRVPYNPAPIAPRIEWLHPAVLHLFMRSFWEGHFKPGLRPDTLSWQFGLEEMEQSLVSCHQNQQHVYAGHLELCPWCERTSRLGGRDPFPSLAAVQAGEHLLPPPTRSPTPLSGSRNTSPWSSAPPAMNPPIPPPISRPSIRPAPRRPVQSQHADAIRAAFGSLRRNEWAWIGLVFGIVATIFMMALPGYFRPLGVLCGMAALFLGIAGEVKSRDWHCDGRGQWPSRIAVALGVISVWILPALRGF